MHKDIRKLLDNLKLSGNPPYWSLELGAARALHEKSSILDVPGLSLQYVNNCHIPLKHHSIAARYYKPDDMHQPAPMLLWLHGGGHVVGSINVYDSVCRRLAAHSKCAVLSIDYRLAPEHKFPAAVEDAFETYAWLLNNPDVLGIDVNRIAVGGDSAGGNLAAVTCFQARDLGLTKPKCQLLVYPAVASHPDSQSHQTYTEGYLLDRKTIDWFQNNYVRTQADRNNPLFAPLLNKDFAGLPPAYITLAECDPLHDEGIAFAEKLRLADNEVTVKTWPGMTHAFFTMGAVLDDAKLAVEEAAVFLKRMLY